MAGYPVIQLRMLFSSRVEKNRICELSEKGIVLEKYFLLALLSAIFSAGAAIEQKKILKKLGALEFSFLLAGANALLVLIYLLLVPFPRPDITSVIILSGKTILGAGAFLCVMIAIKNHELSSVLPLLALTPAFVAVTAFLFLNEKLALNEIAGMILMLGGIYTLETKERNILTPFKIFFSSPKKKFVLFALLLFTVSSVIDKLLVGKYKMNPTDFVLLQQLFLFLVFAFFAIGAGKLQSSLSKLKGNTIKMLLIISALTILYRLFYIKSLEGGAVALMLTIKRLSVFFAVMASGKLLREKNIFRKSIASLFIIIGAYLIIAHAN